ncbi:MAG: TetR/AcrR family transcriptional regulator [Thermodesulfobacteriota bacterium]|nr:TetR/AcrR family transcriptional regulator [Thermodesulfobacteriota bacterium]
MRSDERKIWERQQRKERIIDCAEEIFFSKGFGPSTMDEIAHAAGYKKRTLYLYFTDKDEILLAVVLRGLNLLNKGLEAASSSLHAMAGAYFGFFMENPGYFDLILLYESKTCIYYGTPGSSEDGSFRGQCQRATDRTAEIVSTSIEKGLAEGSIISTLKPRQLMLVLWGQISGIMQVILMRKDHFEDAFGISYKELFDIFLRGVEKTLTMED